MKLCFYQRLALSLVAVFMLVVAMFFVTTNHFQHLTRSEAEQQLHLELAGHLVADNPLLSKGLYDKQALQNLFHTLMLLGPSFEFYYLDPTGRVLTHSAENGALARAEVALAPIEDVLKQRMPLPVFGDDPKSIDASKIFSVAPVMAGEELRGYVYVILGSEKYDSILSGLQGSQSMREFALFMGSCLIFLLISLLVLFKYFTAPLRRLSDDMTKVTEADFQLDTAQLSLHQWRAESENEVHKLGHICNAMLARLNKQFADLKATDTNRRLLLTDLAHDLRTPLANLQGYIETLSLNNHTLSDADRKRFIDISLKNARNLKRLLDQIFELAYLEGGQITLNHEPLVVGELLHDVAAKFHDAASVQHLQINVAPQHLETLINTDIEKLERVLTNLLENAVRHSPQSGQIDLRVRAEQDTVFVEVSDCGVGISEEEQAFIFDARYQAKNAKKDPLVHTGLGLAISKQLTKVLGSDLTVESELGKGTTFRLALARSA